MLFIRIKRLTTVQTSYTCYAHCVDTLRSVDLCDRLVAPVWRSYDSCANFIRQPFEVCAIGVRIPIMRIFKTKCASWSDPNYSLCYNAWERERERKRERERERERERGGGDYHTIGKLIEGTRYSIIDAKQRVHLNVLRPLLASINGYLF